MRYYRIDKRAVGTGATQLSPSFLTGYTYSLHIIRFDPERASWNSALIEEKQTIESLLEFFRTSPTIGPDFGEVAWHPSVESDRFNSLVMYSQVLM